MNILLINPSDPNLSDVSPWPHLGLSILATHAASQGHKALVVDYSFSPNAPPLKNLVTTLSPGLFGVTLYTSQMAQVRRTIQEIRKLSQAPVVIGGPHATLYAGALAEENLADWIFRGECDITFSEQLYRIKRTGRSNIVSSAPPDLSQATWPDFDLAMGSSALTTYPIQLSRGCPYSCSFCSVKNISTRRIRTRPLNDCLDEIDRSIQKNQGIRTVRIVDDCPTFDLDRFKNFLQGYLDRGIRRPLHIDNLRADKIDVDILDLLKRIGVDHLCIGVESGDPCVFEMINKGETLDTIVEAAKLIRSSGFRLYTCFIIGLPGSSISSELASIRLAKSLKPNWIYWNLFQPHQGTSARLWFEDNGRIFGEENKNSLIGLTLNEQEAPCDTLDFPAEERKRNGALP